MRRRHVESGPFRSPGKTFKHELTGLPSNAYTVSCVFHHGLRIERARAEPRNRACEVCSRFLPFMHSTRYSKRSSK
jgi:hypothetical protein